MHIIIYIPKFTFYTELLNFISTEFCLFLNKIMRLIRIIFQGRLCVALHLDKLHLTWNM